MPRKTQQIQIRVTSTQKAALKRLSRAAGQGMSEYVLSRALPDPHVRFAGIVRALTTAGDHRFPLAELNDLLTEWSPDQLSQATSVPPPGIERLPPFLANYVAAMVEQASARRGVPPPDWVRDVPPLETPRFATSLPGLRLHLLRSSPVPFRRRNLFVDATVGDRV